MTKSEGFLLATTRSVKSLLCSTPWLTLHSRYLRRLRVRMYLDSVTSYNWFQHCPRYSRNHLFGRIYGHSIRFVLWIERGWYHTKSPIKKVYSSLIRSYILKIANQNNNLPITMIIDDPTTNYCRSVEDICIAMITRFNRLMFVFKDLDGNIMQLNNEFKLESTIEDRVENEGEGNPNLMSVNQFSMIEVF